MPLVLRRDRACRGLVSKGRSVAPFETPFRQAQWLLRTNGWRRLGLFAIRPLHLRILVEPQFGRGAARDLEHRRDLAPADHGLERFGDGVFGEDRKSTRLNSSH